MKKERESPQAEADLSDVTRDSLYEPDLSSGACPALALFTLYPPVFD
jgi:hypothetical protein